MSVGGFTHFAVCYKFKGSCKSHGVFVCTCIAVGTHISHNGALHGDCAVFGFAGCFLVRNKICLKVDFYLGCLFAFLYRQRLSLYSAHKNIVGIAAEIVTGVVGTVKVIAHH